MRAASRSTNGSELRAGERAVDPPVRGGGGGVEVVAAEDDLERAGAAGEATEPLRAAAARDDAEGDLGLGEDRALDGREPEVEAERELAAAAAGDAVDLGDGHDRQRAPPLEQRVEEAELGGCAAAARAGAVRMSSRSAWATKNSGSALRNTTTRTASSARTSASRRARSVIIATSSRLIGGWSIVTTATPPAGRDPHGRELGLHVGRALQIRWSRDCCSPDCQCPARIPVSSAACQPRSRRSGGPLTSASTG